MDHARRVALAGCFFLSGCGLPGATASSGAGGAHAGGASQASSDGSGGTRSSTSATATATGAGGSAASAGGGGSSASASSAVTSASAATTSSSSGGGPCNPADPGVCCPEQCADKCCHAGNTLICQTGNCMPMQHVLCDDSRDCAGKICCGPWDGPSMSWQGDIKCQDTCVTPAAVGDTGGYELCDLDNPSCQGGRTCYLATSFGHQFGYCF
jgi:hypothetical protein